MKYIYTDFYGEFTCIGGKCSNSCCVGWDVLVDENTYRVYSELPEPTRHMICGQIQNVDDINGVKYKLKMKRDGRCPFLNEQNLCDIYISISPDAMCNVCKVFPRKIANYYDVVMLTVSVACPEAVRILLEKKEPIQFCYNEDLTEVDCEEANWLLYNELINGLVITTNILQDRKYSFGQRLQMAMELTIIIQEHIDNNNLEELRRDVECWKLEEFREKYIRELSLNVESISNKWQTIYVLMENIEEMGKSLGDRLCVLQKYKMIEPTNESKFCCWEEHLLVSGNEIELENLSIEFVFEYYMDALKGNSLLKSMVKMLLLLLEIRIGQIVDFNIKGRMSLEEKTLLVSNICRCMENTQLLDIVAKQLIDTNENAYLLQLAYLLK